MDSRNIQLYTVHCYLDDIGKVCESVVGAVYGPANGYCMMEDNNKQKKDLGKKYIAKFIFVKENTST